MAERYPGGVISKTPPTVTGPVSAGPIAGEGGSASGIWTLDSVLEYVRLGQWPAKIFVRELYSWGENPLGQLGDDTTANRSSPTQVGIPSTWVSIAAGDGHSVAVSSDGRLWCWGDNGSGELGQNNAITIDRSSPVQVGALTTWSFAEAGSASTLAVKNDGTMWGWGNNGSGRIGDNTTINRSSPVQVNSTITDWARFPRSLGGSNGGGIKSDNNLYIWGSADNGFLGNGQYAYSRSTPAQLSSGFTEAAFGSQHVLAVRTTGTLWSWGSNADGKLGQSTPVTLSRSAPVQVGALTDWAVVAAGISHSLAVKTDNTLWSWGLSTNGRLGSGSTRSSPAQVGALTDWAIVAAGNTHSMAIKTDGTLWAWGGNGVGQLGDDTVSSRTSPVQIGLLSNWGAVSVHASADHTLATTKD